MQIYMIKAAPFFFNHLTIFKFCIKSLLVFLRHEKLRKPKKMQNFGLKLVQKTFQIYYTRVEQYGAEL